MLPVSSNWYDDSSWRNERSLMETAGHETRAAHAAVLDIMGRRPALEAPCPAALGARDISNVVRFAYRHGVAGALASGVRAAGGHATWAAALPIFEAIARDQRNRNAELYRSCVAIADLLAAAGIDCVFLKGAAFLVENAGNLDRRFMADLDVLVDDGDVDKTINVLSGAGFTPLADAFKYQKRTHHHAVPMRDRSTGAVVEVHRRILRRWDKELLTAGNLIAQAQQVRCGGTSFRIPRPEHRVIHLIAHAQISNWGYCLNKAHLRDLCDLQYLDQQHDLDWAMVDDAFARYGAAKHMRAFLALTSRVLGVEIPASPIDGPAIAWAERSERGLTGGKPSPLAWFRVGAEYVRIYMRERHRLPVAVQTAINPVLRRQVLASITGRIR